MSWVSVCEIEELEDTKDIEKDTYYLYPSHDVSQALVFSGHALRDWLKGIYPTNLFLTESLWNTHGVLISTYNKDCLLHMLSNWDSSNICVDSIVVTAYLIQGKPIKKIKYGSSLHNKLCNELVED